LIFDIREQQVIAHRYPDLSEDSILACAKKGFNLQILFNPFKKQFDLPSGFVDCGNGGGGQ
jgi:hypothetical protein